MAALLAHAARTSTRLRVLRVLRSPIMLSCSFPVRIGASHTLAWRGTPRSIDWKSYSTHESNTMSTGTGSDPQVSSSATAEHSSFKTLVRGHKRWIRELRDEGELDMILRVVYECYRPLNEAQPALQGAASWLWGACDDAASVTQQETRYSVAEHLDALTQVVEVEAMQAFLSKKRPDLVAAVYYHRKTLATMLTDSTIDLSVHREKFTRLAKRALNDLEAYEDMHAVDLHFHALSRAEKTLRAREEAARRLEEELKHWIDVFTQIEGFGFKNILPSIDPVEHGDGSDIDSRSQDLAAVRESIDELIQKTMLHIEELASRGEFDALLSIVGRRYKPLYDAHPALQSVQCPLVKSSTDDDAAMTTEKRLRMTYNDSVTRRLEVKVMEELLDKRRSDLVVKVYNHRKLMETKVGTVVDEKTGRVTDLADHSKGFFWQAMKASAILRDYALASSVYMDAVKARKTPSPSMINTYLYSLLTMRCHDEVRALYADVKSRELPIHGRFYGHMLYFASKKHDVALMMELREAMKAKEIPLRSEDYLNAIRTSQDKVLGVHGEASTHVPDSYFDCVHRIANNSVPPDVLDACRQVLTLFDEMIEVAKLDPHHKMFTVHSIKAAVLVGEFHRVPRYVELFDRVFGSARATEGMLVDVVNAFLVQEKPTVAWELVIKASNPDNTGEGEQVTVTRNKILASCTSILQYLGTRHDVDLLRQFLDALKAKGLLRQFRRSQHRSLIDAVVLDQARVSDSTILQMLEQYPEAFRVVDKPASLEAFADACMASSRWSLLQQVLETRNRKQIPWIAGSLAVRISNAAIEDESSREGMDLAVEMARTVGLALLTDEDREVLDANAARAAQALEVSTARAY